MKLLNYFKAIVWIITGCPLYFGVISAVVAGGAAIGGAMLSANASKKGAKGQADAANRASESMLQAGRDANDIVDTAYERNQPQIRENYGLARQDLAQYAGLGGGAANQLAQLLGIRNEYNKPTLNLPEKPDFEFGGTYMGLKVPANVSLEAFKAVVDAADQKYQSGNNGRSIFDSGTFQNEKSAFEKRFADQAGKQTSVLVKKYQDEVKSAKAVYAKQLEAWNKQQKTPKGGNYGELLRSFGKAQYMRDPTTGGKAPPDLTRNFTALDYQRDPITGGRLPPDLTRNLTAADYRKDLITGGKAPPDLTRNFSMSDFRTDPGYAFRQQQGNLGIERSGAARGMQLSGATMKALQRFGQNLASDEYSRASDRFNVNRANAFNVFNDVSNRFNANRQNAANVFSDVANRFNINRQNASNVYSDAYNRYTGQNMNKFNMLNTMLGQGQNAAGGRANITQALSNQLTGTSQQRANLMSQNLVNAAGAGAGYSTDAAAATAGGQIGAANAWSQGIGGVANAAMDYSALRNSSYRPDSYMRMGNSYNGWGR